MKSTDAKPPEGAQPKKNEDPVEACIDDLESTIEGMDDKIRAKHILMRRLYSLKTQKLLQDTRRETELQRQENLRMMRGV